MTSGEVRPDFKARLHRPKRYPGLCESMSDSHAATLSSWDRESERRRPRAHQDHPGAGFRRRPLGQFQTIDTTSS
jgi:hypothetical protein